MTVHNEMPGESSGNAPIYRLRLFVAGGEPNSLRAKAVLARLRETALADRCEIVVVDVFQDYQAAIEHHIVVVPALIVESPPPRRVIAGSLNDEDQVLAVLGLASREI